MFRKRKNPPTSTARTPLQVDRTSAKVFSYHASRAPLEPSGDRKRGKDAAGSGSALTSRSPSRMGTGKKMLYILGFLVIMTGIAYNLYITPSPNVTLGGKAEDRLLLHDAATYRAAAQDVLERSLSNRTKLSLRAQEVQDSLLKQFPELESAHITVPLFGSEPELEVNPAVPVAVFVASDSKSYVMDKRGRIISVDPNAAPSGLISVIDQSGLSVGLGNQALPAGDVTFLSRLNNQLIGNGYEVVSFTLPAVGRQVDVRLKDKPYYIKFSSAHDVLQQAGAYDAVQKQLEAGKVTPSEYIDVRIGDRVYYK